MPDRLIRGRYRIGGLLNEGGVARISTAVDSLTGVPVIIKEPVSNDPASRQAIVREYEFIRLHTHPAVVPVDAFIGDNDRACMIMPYIDGVELKSWFSGKIGTGSDGPRKPLIDKVLAAILECAAFIHFCGYLYNDFKPENFLAVEDSAADEDPGMKPLLLDFNLICRREEQPPRRGTLTYISPEVLKGEAPSVASDLYSLGATIFELLSGHPPYVSTNSDELIMLVTEAAAMDFSNVPSSYREGMFSLLSSDPENRPKCARDAAGALGLETIFDELLAARVESYLAAGPPPFAGQLRGSLKDYLNDSSYNVFLVCGMSHNAAAWNYIACLLELEGREVHRIRRDDDKTVRQATLRALERNIGGNKSQESILIVDDYEILSEAEITRLNVLVRADESIPVAIGAGRWSRIELPTRVFDPVKDRTCKGATAESLRALLKEPDPQFDYRQLSEITGGDPELVYRFILEMISRGDLTLPVDSRTGDIGIPSGRIPDVDRSLEKMCSLLDDEERLVMDRLSAWGTTIPLLLLADLDSNQRANVDRLVKARLLIRQKDSVSFPSGAARNLLYSQLSDSDQQRYHRFWAEAAENRLEDPFERLEMTAVHWGRSDDKSRGYRANINAAIGFLRGGKLSKARGYAERALELAQEGGGSVSAALSTLADIARTQGDYTYARAKYIKLLSLLREDGNNELKAKSLRELGDIYRSLKLSRKAVAYTERALRLYEQLSDEQGVADCHNSIGLARWVEEEYTQALDSFESAAKMNRMLANHRELAKIESNQGIIKDMMGRTGEVRSHFLLALENAGRAGDDRLQALISNNLGFFLIRQGEFEQSRQHLEVALKLSEQIGYTEEIINSLTNLGLCNLRLGHLIESVDCNQRARELAISFGNKHLAADAELNLTEACILMGNYGLADTVLRSIESSSIYNEDRMLKFQVDLLRSRWLCSIGDLSEGFKAAAGVSLAAEESANKRLRLEAEIVTAASIRISSPETALSRLAPTAEECQMLGHSDLLVQAGLLMAEIHFDSGDKFSSESWLEKILSTPNLPTEIFIRASILSAEILKERREFDGAIERLVETEGLAAEKGFVPLALRSSVVLSEILVECRKYHQAEKSYMRARAYRERIMSALPETVSADSLRREPFMARLASGLAGIKDRSLLKI